MITTNYRGIDITYNEGNETWNCQVASKFRSRTNLKDCKDAIDKFLDGEEKLKKKFDRFDVWSNDYHRGWGKLTVTSITDDAVWTTDEKGNRQKKSDYDCKRLYLITDENQKLIDEIKATDEKIKELNQKNEDTYAKLQSLEPKTILKSLS